MSGEKNLTIQAKTLCGNDPVYIQAWKPKETRNFIDSDNENVNQNG